MSIPAFGWVFIPIALWVFFVRPQYLLSLMVFASIFGGASVIDLALGDSDFGVQPYYFVGCLVAIRALPVLFRYRSSTRDMEPDVRKVVLSLSRFWRWAIASAFLFPILFKGVQVIDPRISVDDRVKALAIETAATPLHWSLENLGQAVYLSLSVIALFYAFASRKNRSPSRNPSTPLRVAITVVSIVCLAQAVAAWAGWSFPYSFFNSNPGYAQSIEAAFGDVSRVNSTFPEASFAGGFLAAGALGLLAKRLQAGRGSLVLVFLAVIGLMLTTATTGLATLFIGGVFLAIYFAREGIRKLISRRALRRSALSLLLVIAAVAVVLAGYPGLRQAILEMTLEKVDTVSFAARFSLDAYSIRQLFSTYGLGMGLGSNRASSLIAGLLSNVGLVGMYFFILFVAGLIAQLVRMTRRQGGSQFAMVTWMLAGLLVAQCVAIPDVNWPPLWAALIVAASLSVYRFGVRSGRNEIVNVLPSQETSPGTDAI